MISFRDNYVVPIWLAALALALTAQLSLAGEVLIKRDAATGWRIYSLRQGETTVRVAPAAGANAFSIEHRGVEYLRVPDELSKLPGVSYGNPILYPTPNRVRGAKFTFEGTTYQFPQNNNGNFIHGLVHSEAFEVESAVANGDAVEMVCSLGFAPGGRPHELFPFPHLFRVTIVVT